MMPYVPVNPALQYVQFGAPLAPNAQNEGQFSQVMNVVPQIVPHASQIVISNVILDRPADYHMLDDKIRAIEGFSAFGMDARDLCLVPNVVLPQKFKILDFPKYRGLSCPRSHVTMYCRKMASYIDNNDLLIHCFQDGLSGASLDLLELHNQSQKYNETFKEYAYRWPEMASWGLYFEKMIGSSPSIFADIVTIGEIIENGVKSRKITDIVSQPAVNKKPQGSFSKKKEGETSDVAENVHPQ
ncbi:uncharacterized protein LOC127122662 [Lathyrus oleraceus]|uniref:uncharacterized protein LOC127122662 n=1 Tax=Pisum sativum TaxID=3888 RepID=UPI0021CF1D3C|nr:uncharacterized protein LOC127122662 [Pisum sativum]